MGVGAAHESVQAPLEAPVLFARWCCQDAWLLTQLAKSFACHPVTLNGYPRMKWVSFEGNSYARHPFIPEGVDEDKIAAARCGKCVLFLLFFSVHPLIFNLCAGCVFGFLGHPCAALLGFLFCSPPLSFRVWDRRAWGLPPKIPLSG